MTVHHVPWEPFEKQDTADLVELRLSTQAQADTLAERLADIDRELMARAEGDLPLEGHTGAVRVTESTSRVAWDNERLRGVVKAKVMVDSNGEPWTAADVWEHLSLVAPITGGGVRWRALGSLGVFPDAFCEEKTRRRVVPV